MYFEKRQIYSITTLVSENSKHPLYAKHISRHHRMFYRKKDMILILNNFSKLKPRTEKNMYN